MNDALRKIRERVLAFSPDESGSPFPFSERLAPENRWNPAFARRVIEEYEKFAFLAVAAGHPVVPSDAVDQAWHLHLTCTRSYWEDFCPKVLGRPLHHHPARGGAVERAKFDGGYRKTVASYRRLFGVAPPGDIWPAPEMRFLSDTRFVWVDARRHWLVPKPAGGRGIDVRSGGLGVGVALLALPLPLASCQDTTGTFGPMEPSGAAFFVLYLFAGLLLGYVVRALRSALSLPVGKDRPVELPLAPEELAYLAGGGEAGRDGGAGRLDAARRRGLGQKPEDPAGGGAGPGFVPSGRKPAGQHGGR